MVRISFNLLGLNVGWMIARCRLHSSSKLNGLLVDMSRQVQVVVFFALFVLDVRCLARDLHLLNLDDEGMCATC